MAEAGIHVDSGNLSRKIIAVAAGEAHTLALTGDGSVYSWGRGTFGRLGNGSELDQLYPVKIEFNSTDKRNGVKIVGTSAGAYHSIALADDGSVWSWGYNTYGQLGINGENSFSPRMVEAFQGLSSPSSNTNGSITKSETTLKMSSVKAGGMMSLAIDDLGALWIWGNCPLQDNSNEREFSLVTTYTPVPVWDFHGHTVVKVACGSEHIIALVSSGETHNGGDLLCYSWGNNNHGQLGVGDTEPRSAPQMVESFNSESSWTPYEVACGAFHTSLLAYRNKDSDISDALESVCWTFGLGDNGQLGQGTTRKSMYPEKVKGLPENVFLISVDCGLFHTSVVSSSGNVWSWGMENGLGLCPEATFTEIDGGDALVPRMIGRDFSQPVQVACGAAHTVLVADNGYKIWSWGRGRSGVLGNGQTVDFFAPSIVLWPPLDEDFKKDVSKTDLDREEITESEKKLSDVIEEMNVLRSKLSLMERYASILHGSVFGKPFEGENDIPLSLRNTGSFDIAKEWENMLDSCDRGKLLRLEMFYRNMLAGVEDKKMKQRIKELIKDYLESSTSARH